jgi:uncharacterized membrane protein YphA (DoxX/SURF4 family)
VPLAPIGVPLSGVVTLAGGFSIRLGYRDKIGAWLPVLFLVGGALLISQFGAGSWSLDARWN